MRKPTATHRCRRRHARGRPVGLVGSRLAVWAALLGGGLLLVMVAVGQSAALAWTVDADSSVSAGPAGAEPPAAQEPEQADETPGGQPEGEAGEGTPEPVTGAAAAGEQLVDEMTPSAEVPQATPDTVGAVPGPAPGGTPGAGQVVPRLDQALPARQFGWGSADPGSEGVEGGDEAAAGGDGTQLPDAPAPDVLERLGYGPPAPPVASMPPVAPPDESGKLGADWLERVTTGKVTPEEAQGLDWMPYLAWWGSELNIGARPGLDRYFHTQTPGLPSLSGAVWDASKPEAVAAASKWLDLLVTDPDKGLALAWDAYSDYTDTEFGVREWDEVAQQWAAGDPAGLTEAVARWGNEVIYPHAFLTSAYAGLDRGLGWLTTPAKDPGQVVDDLLAAANAQHERAWDPAHFPDLSLPFDPNTMTWQTEEPGPDTTGIWLGNVLQENAYELGWTAVGSEFNKDVEAGRYPRAIGRALTRAFSWGVFRMLPRLAPAGEGGALPPGTDLLGEPASSVLPTYGEPTHSFGEPGHVFGEPVDSLTEPSMTIGEPAVAPGDAAVPPPVPTGMPPDVPEVPADPEPEAVSGVVKWTKDYDDETARLQLNGAPDSELTLAWQEHIGARSPRLFPSDREVVHAVSQSEADASIEMVLDAYGVDDLIAIDASDAPLVDPELEPPSLEQIQDFLGYHGVDSYPAAPLRLDELIEVTKGGYPAIVTVDRGGRVGYLVVDDSVTFTTELDGGTFSETIFRVRDPAMISWPAGDSESGVARSAQELDRIFLGSGVATRPSTGNPIRLPVWMLPTAE